MSKELSTAFPEMRGFSRTNLFYIRKWYLFYWQAHESVPQLENHLSGIAHVDTGQELVPQAVVLNPWGITGRLSPIPQMWKRPFSM